MNLAAIMAADPSEIYEPWQPQIGQRVQVRLSGECQVPDLRGRDPGHPGAEMLDGQTGVVCDPELWIGWRTDVARLLYFYAAHGHRLCVAFDAPVFGIPGYPSVTGGIFAVCEVEPLEEGGATEPSTPHATRPATSQK